MADMCLESADQWSVTIIFILILYCIEILPKEPQLIKSIYCDRIQIGVARWFAIFYWTFIQWIFHGSGYASKPLLLHTTSLIMWLGCDIVRRDNARWREEAGGDLPR